MIPKEIIPIKEKGIPNATHKESLRLKNSPRTKHTKNNPITKYESRKHFAAQKDKRGLLSPIL